MHWTISVGTFLYLLFYAHIVIINFAICTTQGESDIKSDYNHFESKYFDENETYSNDKRLIIEDFYRQSALSVKNIQDISFHINATSKTSFPIVESAPSAAVLSTAMDNITNIEGEKFLIYYFLKKFYVRKKVF